MEWYEYCLGIKPLHQDEIYQSEAPRRVSIKMTKSSLSDPPSDFYVTIRINDNNSDSKKEPHVNRKFVKHLKVFLDRKSADKDTKDKKENCCHCMKTKLTKHEGS